MADVTIPKGDHFTVGQATKATTGTPGGVHVPPFAQFGAYGGCSAPNWYARGIGLDFPAQAYTDTTSSGDHPSVYIANWGTQTIHADHPTRFRRAATLKVNPVKAGRNVTIDYPYCITAVADCEFEGQNYMGGAHVKGPLTVKGDLYVKPSEGRPTDIPERHSGVVAVRYDTVGRRWWAYDDGEWR